MIGFSSRPRPHLALLALAALTACPSDDVAPIESETEAASTTSGADETATEAASDETADSSGSGGEAVCGNGMIEAGETCDDGNTEDGDACPATCRVESCSLVWTWSEAIADGSPGANAMVVDAEGNAFSAGSFPEADTNIWVARWANDGSQTWSTTIDSGNGIDVALGLTLDDAGDLYLAGRTPGDADAMYFAKLSGADGSEIWSQTIDSMFADEDDIGIDVALLPDGDVVVVGRMRMGEGDDDVWVSRRSAADGSEVWASTWSGAGDGMFSTDRVSAVDVGPDGSIWIVAREFVDFETQEAVLLRYDADGNETLVDLPLADGMPHEHNGLDVAAYDGGAYAAFVHGSAPYRAWIFKYDNDGNQEWTLTQDDWLDEDAGGEDYRLRLLNVADDGRVLIGGQFDRSGGPGGDHDWSEAWVAQLDADSNVVCRGAHMEDDGAPFAPILSIFSGAGGPSGGIVMSGRAAEGAGIDTWLWTGYFAP